MLSFGVSPGRVWCLGCVSFPKIIMVNPLSRVFLFHQGKRSYQQAKLDEEWFPTVGERRKPEVGW